MRHSLEIGFSFGLTSGIITTLGLMIGLNAGTGSRAVVVGGILTIAIADAFSDALGIHFSEESENKHTPKQIWEATMATFFFKFFFALTFLLPVLIFNLGTAIIVSIIWGLSLLGILSYRYAKDQKINPYQIVGEHLAIAVLVILITHFVGDRIAKLFG